VSRLSVPKSESTTGAVAEIYAQIKKAIVNVPNTLATIGAYGPAALAVLAADSALASGTLTKRDQETIEPVISGVAGGDYCVAAHGPLGKLAGLKPHDLKIRNGEPTGDVKRDALARFVRTLAETRCTVSDDNFAAIKAAGYTDAQLVDISRPLQQLSSPTSSTASTTPRSTSQQSRNATASV
jgi:AhpD family alkylhydroperoxidase